MPLPTEPIGSIPRPRELLAALDAYRAGRIDLAGLDAAYDAAVEDTVRRFEATGSPVITDGEQRKPSFLTYPLQLLDTLAADGLTIAFADGHARQLPRLIRGPFRYAAYADAYLERARRFAHRPMKQAVIGASALSLLYPRGGIPDYPESAFLSDLKREAALDIRRCFDRGADSVQIDFTEGRLAVKLDPSKALLRRFVDLDNAVIERFSHHERERIGVHTCPGADRGSTHSADVDYADLLPDLFRIEAGRFYVQLASERDRRRVLGLIKQYRRPKQTIFVGVIDPLSKRIETAEEVRDRVLEAAAFIPPERLGTTDDCGFAPFGDDTSTARDLAFAKIEARVTGTRLAEAAGRAEALAFAGGHAKPSRGSKRSMNQRREERPMRIRNGLGLMAGAAMLASLGAGGEAEAGFLFSIDADIGAGPAGQVTEEDLFEGFSGNNREGLTTAQIQAIDPDLVIPTSLGDLDQVVLNSTVNQGSNTLSDGSVVTLADGGAGAATNGTYDLFGAKNKVFVVKAGNFGLVYSDMTEPGTDAWNIADAGIQQALSNVQIYLTPVPAAAWILLAALGGLLGVKRWQRRTDAEPAAA